MDIDRQLIFIFIWSSSCPFGRLWFALFGLTPRTCVALIPLFDLLIVWCLVRFAKTSAACCPAFCFSHCPLIIPSSFLNLTHAIEPIFVIHALADQATANRRRALTLATTCVFIKPSKAFSLGFALVILILSQTLHSSAFWKAEIIRQAWPTAATGLLISTVVALGYGFGSLVRTVLPLGGVSAYRAQGFGFFNGADWLFLASAGAPWSYYLVSLAGPWLLYTAALIVATMLRYCPIRGLLETLRRQRQNGQTKNVSTGSKPQNISSA